MCNPYIGIMARVNKDCYALWVGSRPFCSKKKIRLDQSVIMQQKGRHDHHDDQPTRDSLAGKIGRRPSGSYTAHKSSCSFSWAGSRHQTVSSSMKFRLRLLPPRGNLNYKERDKMQEKD